ncbi:MAG: GNAT family N-acetyltransferase [Nocardioides sp.]
MSRRGTGPPTPEGVSIRTAETSDVEELMRFFVGLESEATIGRLWGDPPSEAAIYLTPYVGGDAASVLTAEVDGTLAGYLAGCYDTARFPSEADRFEFALRTHRPFRRPGSVRFFARSVADARIDKVLRRATATDLVDERWPAHLHIQVAGAWHGTGVADALMSTWLDHLRERRVSGCHLQTLLQNQRARGFFARHGFVPYGDVAQVPGVRHDRRRVQLVTMVRALP